MPRLDRTIDLALGLLKHEVHRQITIKKEKDSFWMGRKIISVAKWEKLSQKHTREQMFKFIPESYVESPFGFVDIPFGSTTAFKDWYKIWKEFLWSRKDPDFGHEVCHGCILNTDVDKAGFGFMYPKSTSIRDVILKHPLAKGVEIGCPMNVFECPHGQIKENVDLFKLARIWKTIDDALKTAHYMTYYNHGVLFEVNFDSRIASVQRNWFSDPMQDGKR